MDIKVDDHTVICFDLDDTLYNEIDFLRSGYKFIAGQLEHEWQSLFDHMINLYSSGKNAFEYVSKVYDLSISEQLEIYRSHQPDISPFPGVKKIFKDIDSYSGKIAVLTDGRSITQRHKIQALGLNSWIDEIIISEESGYEKPDPYNFNMVTDRFPDHKYSYIGDNPSKDFVVPNKLGWETICVRDNGKNIHDQSFKGITDPVFYPDHFVDAIGDLIIIPQDQQF